MNFSLFYLQTVFLAIKIKTVSINYIFYILLTKCIHFFTYIYDTKFRVKVNDKIEQYFIYL